MISNIMVKAVVIKYYYKNEFALANIPILTLSTPNNNFSLLLE